MKKRTLRQLGVIAALLAAPAASAHPFDTYGFGARAIGMGGGFTAAATDVGAGYYNPAAATRTRAFAARLGILVADDFLEANDRDAKLGTTTLYQLGLSTPVPLGRLLHERVFLSLLASFPQGHIFDVQLPDDEDVSFPFWDGRNRRLVLTGSLAVRPADWLSLGAGATLTATVLGKIRIALTGGQGDNSGTVDIGYDLAPVVGLLLEPLEWLSFGATWRGAQHLPLTLPVDAEVIDDVAPIHTTLTARAYAVPHELAFGFRLVPWRSGARRLELAADLTWYRYSDFRYASPDVVVYDDQGGVVQESRATVLQLSDTWVPRVGLEWSAASWLDLRAGWGWVPSPVPAQTGPTNQLDADRNVLSLGLGFELPEALLWEGCRGLRVDLHGQLHLLARREFEKAELMPENPGYPSITVSGGTFSAGLDLRLLF